MPGIRATFLPTGSDPGSSTQWRRALPSRRARGWESREVLASLSPLPAPLSRALHPGSQDLTCRAETTPRCALPLRLRRTRLVGAEPRVLSRRTRPTSGWRLSPSSWLSVCPRDRKVPPRASAPRRRSAHPGRSWRCPLGARTPQCPPPTRGSGSCPSWIAQPAGTADPGPVPAEGIGDLRRLGCQRPRAVGVPRAATSPLAPRAARESEPPPGKNSA